MIMLKELDKAIRTLKGQTIADFSGKGVLTYKDAFITICEMHRPDKPGTGDALRAFSLGSKFVEAKDQIELSPEEIEFLKRIINESNVFIATIVGRLSVFLDKEKVEEKKV